MGDMLARKTAIVTGGATGIGEAISKRFAREGARVLVNGLPGDPVDEVVVEIRRAGGAAESLIGDVSQPDVAREMVQKAVSQFICIDICVANAAQMHYGGKLGTLDPHLFDQVVHNNLYGFFYTLQNVLPELAKTKGVFISLGANAGRDGLALAGPYAATNGAIHALTMTAALEYADIPVRVVNVAPGIISTGMSRSDVGTMPQATCEALRAATPLGRFGSPQEVAHVITFVASDQASFLTGTTITVDGGFSTAHGIPGKSVHHVAPAEDLGLRHQFSGYHPPKAA